MLNHSGTIRATTRIVTPMKRLPEGAVGDREHQTDEEQDEDDDEAHPRERDHGGEQTAGEVLMAPREVAPIRLQARARSYQYKIRDDAHESAHLR